MRGVLKFMEWALIILIGAYLALILFPHNWFDRDEQLQEYKRDGLYQAVDLDPQTYYGKRISVRGIAYGHGKLTVYMKGSGFAETGRAPNQIKVTTDQGKELEYDGGASSNDIWGENASYIFRDVPEHIKQITITPLNHYTNGDTFSFTISLQGGNPNDEK